MCLAHDNQQYFGFQMKFTTVNSLMFTGINVCAFETKQCLRGLIFTVCSGLVNNLGTWILSVGIYFGDLKMVANCAKYINPSQTLMNLQYLSSDFVVHNTFCPSIATNCSQKDLYT